MSTYQVIAGDRIIVADSVVRVIDVRFPRHGEKFLMREAVGHDASPGPFVILDYDSHEQVMHPFGAGWPGDPWQQRLRSKWLESKWPIVEVEA